MHPSRSRKSLDKRSQYTRIIIYTKKNWIISSGDVRNPMAVPQGPKGRCNRRIVKMATRVSQQLYLFHVSGPGTFKRV